MKMLLNKVIKMKIKVAIQGELGAIHLAKKSIKM